MSATSTPRTAEHNSIRGMVFPTLSGSCPFPSRKLRVASEPAGPKCCRNATVARVKVLAQPDKDLLVEVLFHFHHSLNRKEKYFTDTEPIKILKHCSTRWLSLEKCVNRLLDHWSAPPELFQLAWGCGEAWTSKGLCLSNPEMHLYFNFISLILQPLNDFNTLLQAEESRIGYLKDEITTLVRKFLGKFVKTKVIKSAVNITDSDCQLHDDIIAVGVTTRAYIVDHADEIPSSTLSMFFTPIRKFYESLTAKMLAKFPFKDPVVLSLRFLNPTIRGDLQPSILIDLSRRFPSVIPKNQWNQLEEEFLDFQTIPSLELSTFLKTPRLTSSWWIAMKNRITNTLRFPMKDKLWGQWWSFLTPMLSVRGSSQWWRKYTQTQRQTWTIPLLVHYWL